MKFFIAALLSVVVAIQGAPSPSAVGETGTLFEDAWDYQARLVILQKDINEQLTAMRTSVSGVLSASSNVTLGEIENQASLLLAQDEPARNQIFELPASLCANNLKVLINSITEFTGFGSSNCVTAYDTGLQVDLDSAYAELQKYEGSFGDVLRIVVRSFNGRNVYLQAADIKARFVDGFSQREADWAAVRPDVERFVKALGDSVADHNKKLAACHKTLRDNVAPAYGILQSEIATCETFNSTPDPFARFRA